jgi:hypothetical protein
MPAMAQEDPTQVGGGQLPYILIVMDTSGSTEWTHLGDETYPVRDPAEYSTGTWFGSDYPDRFVAGEPMGIGFDGESEHDGGPKMFGPCVTWEPDSCGDYHRPAWTFEAPSSWTPHYNDTSLMFNRISSLVRDNVPTGSNPRARLRESSQPRHVTMKEILTGDMVLMTETQVATGVDPLTLDPDIYGPGCWFVPRQRGATIQNDDPYCVGSNEFEDYPDHLEPTPHLQEVYDAQIDNGLLDSLSGAAIFAFAALDGYRDDESWLNDLNDDMRGNAPPSATAFRVPGSIDETTDCDWTEDPMGAAIPRRSPCYDLGIYRVVGPTDLQIPSTFLGELSAYTQVAIRDSGFLSRNSGSDFELDPDEKKAASRPWLGVRFSKDFDRYVDRFELGKQPIGAGTPLAAAIHDVHQFFRDGQQGMEAIQNDDFRECRQKHVVLITDGYPEPERTGIGSEVLTPAFNYYPGRYPYANAVDEINDLWNDTENRVPPSDATDQFKFGPRVHVVGVRDEDSDEQADVGRKLHEMAAAGQTCAQYYLGPDWYPATPGGNDCPRANAGIGTCVDTGQAITGYVFTPPDDGASTFVCPNPALILNTNDRDEVEAALAEIFNGIIGTAGVASRTRTVVTNRLDDINIPNGGQYRFFSGVEIGGSSYWGGVLNRQTLDCAGSPASINPIHQEIAAQVDLVSDPPQDNRRIFTALPHEDIYDYSAGAFGFRSLDTSITTTMFFAHFDLREGSSGDEFGGSSMDLALDSDLVGKRLSFESVDVYDGPPSSVSDADISQMLNVADEAEFREVVDNYRGRVLSKQGRALNGILNGNPVVVGPPDLDLPSESYRAYKARHGDRPTMLYVPTMDGLLHAIHTGQNDGRIQVRQFKPENTTPVDTSTGTVSAADQREAWAYLPNMFLRSLSSRVTSQPYLMDGTPAVKDVRLCHQNPDFNTNVAACRSVSTSGSFPAERQWRSVLVQGLGKAGTGYFAMDVTRPGQLEPDGSGNFVVTNPDPIPLWEFTPEWEERQIEWLLRESATETRVLPNNAGSLDDPDPCSDDNEFWEQSMMGISVSDPEIATVIIENNDFGSTVQLQRPVAVFGAGQPDPDRTGCGASGGGYAIYVVDLQTGSIIRRFVEYKYPNDGNYYTFVDGHSGNPGALVGTPTLYDSFPGNVATRGFIGDSFGRLFRIDLTNPNPDAWEVSLFFDPEDSFYGDQITTARDAEPGLGGDPFGPAAYKPAIAVNEQREPIIVYGLGEVGDAAPNNQAQAVIALREDISTNDAVLEWFHVMELGEKLTGAPLIFNRTVFFPTFWVENEDRCSPGRARIYQLNYLPETGVAAEGLVDTAAATSAGFEVDPNGLWFGPAEPVLIRGLTLTLGAICSVQGVGTDTQTFVEDANPQPELIAQTGGTAVSSTLTNAKGGSAGAQDINRIVAPVDRPQSAVIPLSWNVISN